MKTFNRKPKSPYAKYQKAPYLYSAPYQDWRAEVKRHGGSDSEECINAENRHRRMCGVPERDLSTSFERVGFTEVLSISELLG